MNVINYMPLTQNSITFFCKNFEAIWLKCLKSIWPTHVSPETVPRTYSHRKQSPKHQFYQPQQHLIKPVSLVEGCDFSRRVELTDSLPNHHKKKAEHISMSAATTHTTAQESKPASLLFLSEWVFQIFLLMALCWSMRPHNALLIDGLLFF